MVQLETAGEGRKILILCWIRAVKIYEVDFSIEGILNNVRIMATTARDMAPMDILTPERFTTDIHTVESVIHMAAMIMDVTMAIAMKGTDINANMSTVKCKAVLRSDGCLTRSTPVLLEFLNYGFCLDI